MNLRYYLAKIFEWCPLNSGDKLPNNNNFLKLTKLKNTESMGFEEKTNLYQICPKCKKLVLEEDLICPYCNTSLSSQYVKCPFCSETISQKNTACPHCGRLLIYESSKQVAAKRNVVLFPLGLLLLLSMTVYWYLNWQEIIDHNSILSNVFILLWLIGFVLFGAYVGKGDKDFWWGK